MTRLELVSDEAGREPADGPFAAGEPLPRRLPPGRHGIPANLVVEHQRRRLLAAMAEALAEHGYACVTTTQISELANVSTSTFYKHFGNLWDCVLAAYVASADRLCEQIDAACAARDPRAAAMRVGIACSSPRLAAMLRRDRPAGGEPSQPPGLDERLIDATLAFVCSRLGGGDPARLASLGPELVAILDRPRRAA